MKKNGIVLFVVSLFFTSCVTQQRVLTMLTPESPQYFVRPVQFVSGEYKTLLDCTLQVKNAEIQGDVIVNYSVSPKKDLQLKTSLPVVVFSTPEGAFKTSSISLMYIDINSGVARYTSTMSPEQFTTIIKNVDTLAIYVEQDTRKGKSVVSKKLNDSLKMLTRVIY